MNQVAVSRRRFLVGAGAAAASAFGVGACTGGARSATPTTSVTTTGVTATSVTTEHETGASAGAVSDDTQVAAMVARLEVVAVGLYRSAGAAGTANQLGTVPPALTTFVSVVGGHHAAALDRWNSILTNGGATGVTEPDTTLQATVERTFARITDATALARLALLVEQTVSDTYFVATSTLQSNDAITLAAQLQAVDQEHAAVLHFILGSYPVPDAFQNGNMAVDG